MSTPAGPDRVIIFDTTLRDGEQSPGISLNAGEKLEIAHQLARLGVDVIEAGFPIASPGDFEAVRAIARADLGGSRPTIAALARAQAGDIERAGEAVREAAAEGRGRIHTFISTSDIHIEHQMRNTRADVLEGAKAAVAHARSLVDDVEFSPMDATRADVEFTAQVIQVAIDEGATTINVPDTVGYATPDEYAAFLRRLYEHAPGLRDVVLSVHCHDDLGLAVANSLAGLGAGARQVECAVNGIGERAGNTALEELIMLLATRGDRLGYATGAVTTEIARTSRLVSRLTGYAVQPNKAIVGRNAFSHESGIHQDGVLKDRSTFEIMDPASVGIDDAEQLVLGKHSGRAALKDALARLGHPVDGQELRRAFDAFKVLADRKKTVTAMDLEALVADELEAGEDDDLVLVDYTVEVRDARPPHATVVLESAARGRVTGSFTGDGPVDAVFRALDSALGVDARLRDYRVASVTGGQDALAQASVVLELGTPGSAERWDIPGVTGGERITAAGQGVDTDTLRASAIAYLRALNLGVRRVAGPRPQGDAAVAAP
ncbi:2-isopropylmalate synthase [Patulibacter sp. SYSU D01012]|uniref:2-isopropylmalate synthase n=1 Tax=Patulibacter sp. SYSU D01012 TaxID=2817381 RepID=UPI001B30E537|nr:2-isopropylmalate synthase [Patulibacter sp. SYSU D01012]